MTTWIKAGVKLGDTTAMVLLHAVVSEVMAAFGVSAVVTSAADGTHRADSLHYLNRALDYRTRDIEPIMRKHVAAAIQRKLGNEFDVVLEDDHLHVEWDPDSEDAIA